MARVGSNCPNIRELIFHSIESDCISISTWINHKYTRYIWETWLVRERLVISARKERNRVYRSVAEKKQGAQRSSNVCPMVRSYATRPKLLIYRWGKSRWSRDVGNSARHRYLRVPYFSSPAREKTSFASSPFPGRTTLGNSRQRLAILGNSRQRSGTVGENR